MPRARRLGVIAAVTTLVAAVIGGGTAWAAFTRTTANPTNTFSAAPDFVTPKLNRSIAGETVGNMAGHIHPGSSYQFFGNVTDTGNPASGVFSVKADFSSLDAGQSAATMTAGAFTYASTSYSNRTGTLTADSTLTSCSYTPTVTSTDAAGNSRTENANPVMVDRDLLSEYYVRIDGAVASDQQGLSVASAGDGDGAGEGKPDALIGADLANNSSGVDTAGSAFVVFGKASSTTIDLASLGGQGYRIDGAVAFDGVGVSVANAGDVNGDGKPDALLSASNAGNNSRATSGSSYIVFGKAIAGRSNSPRWAGRATASMAPPPATSPASRWPTPATSTATANRTR